MPFKRIFEQLFKRPSPLKKNIFTGASQIESVSKEDLEIDDRKLIEMLRHLCEEPITDAKNMPVYLFKDVWKRFKTTDLRVITESEVYKKMLEKGFVLGSGEERIYYGEKAGQFSETERANIHLGVDYMVKEGIKVSAVADGEVIEVENIGKEKQELFESYGQGLYRGEGGYGNMILLEHKLGSGKAFYSLYGHLGSPENPLKVGDKIKKGEVIGAVGKSFSLENGGWPSHLHFNILKEKDAIAGYGAKEEIKKMIDPLEVFNQKK